MGDAARGCAACCVGTIFLVTVILFAVSFDTLDVTEMGIKHNAISLEIDESNVYGNGRYFLGLGNSFIEFPINLIPIEFVDTSALRAWSKEGQLIGIDVGFYYKLNRSSIVELFKKYGENYHTRFVQIAVRAIKQVTIQYNAQEFFLKRTLIGDHMLLQLRKSFGEENHLSIELFALREISIPAEFEQKVISKVVVAQYKQTAEWTKNIDVGNAKIQVLQGEGQAGVNLTRASARATATLITEKAKADGIKAVANTEAAAYSNLSASLELAPKELLQYKYGKLIGAIDQSRAQPTRVLMGFDSPVLKVGV